jgi:3-phenylpropionate/trans-cinnamate dioxygenase ferredoxin subunit
MAFAKYKWYKVADKETDIQWTAGGVAEFIVNDKKLCIGRFQPRGDAAAPTTPAGAAGSATPAAASPQLFGFAYFCPHAGAPLTDGYIDGACHLVCPVHQLKFNLRNGRDINGEGYKLKTYPIEIRADGIFIGLDEGGLFKWF